MVTSRMNTVQEAIPNTAFPPPCRFPDLQNQDRSEDSTHNNARPDPAALDTNQLPDRCQFTFSDGRQCRMARSEIHPSRCPFHAEREDQLFGEPSPGGYVVGAALDLPELYSACRDLTTAAGVNRALAQVFRLLAQRRISRQEAATFGHLAQPLLRTIAIARAEHPIAERQKGVSPRESHGDQELSRVTKSTPFLPQKEVALSPDNKVAAPGDHSWAGSECDHERSAQFASRTVLRDTPPVSSPVKSVHSWAPAAVAPAAALSSQASQNEDLRNSRVQLTQNEHLRKVVT